MTDAAHSARYDSLERLRKSVLVLVEELSPEPIRTVGFQMAGEMAAYHQSAKFFRRKRAECLHTALAFKLMGLQSGRNHSAFIKHHLARCLEWRRKEYSATAPLVVQTKQAA